MKFTKTTDVSVFDKGIDLDSFGITIVPDIDLDFTDSFDFVNVDTSAFDDLVFDPLPTTFASTFGSASSSGAGFSSISVSAMAYVSNDGQAFTSLDVSTVGNATVSADVLAIGDNISFDFF